MPATAAKKSSKPSGPTWSKVVETKKETLSKSSATRRSKGSVKPTPIRAEQGASRSKPRVHKASAPFEIPAHLQRELAGIVLLVIAALFGVGLFSWSSGGHGVLALMGGVIAQLFGLSAWLVPIALALAALVLLVGVKGYAHLISPAVPVGAFLMLLGFMAFSHLFTNGQAAAELGRGGGYIGLAISTLLSDYLTKWGAGIVLLGLLLVGFMLAFGVSLGQVIRGVGRPAMSFAHRAGDMLGEVRSHLSTLIAGKADDKTSSHGPVRINGELALHEASSPPTPLEGEEDSGEKPDSHSVPTQMVNLLGIQGDDNAPAEEKKKPEPVINQSKLKKGEAVETPQIPVVSPTGYIWNLPPLTLLEGTSETKVSPADIKNKIRVIEETLQSFNVEAAVREVNTGPAVTQFAIEPGVGVRVSKITQLDKDLALALAAPDIRIEAPIPGQSRIGIEVPNVSLQVVGLRGIIESDVFQNSKGRLKISLGRDTHGNAVVTDMAKLPHLLVAGATGSGKSVFLNSMVVGFMLQFTPDDLRMLMIDPKRVELTGFNGIPHLLRPVVTDVRMDKEEQTRARASGVADRDRPLTAVEVLKWALWEMERRYKLFAKGQRGKDGLSKVFRNIEGYRTFQRENLDVQMEHLPYIVIIIDELADLMLTAPEEVETSLCRLAQLARATGIHLVVATQRPSVDVVTGLIKANFPARAAFAVASYRDSQVILDSAGAEKLLGKGDMLYTASDESKPVRIQGTFVSDAESDNVVSFWRKQLPSENGSQEAAAEVVAPMPMPDWLGTGDADAESEMLEQAIELVKRNRFVSVSMLQRKLRVGYNRAARLVEQMEELGLIAPANSENRGKPREVLIGAPDNRGLDPGDVAEET
ncbi:MAG: DNA translocase FtsK [Chloroflexota bacterium]|nr:DNA translocase FtsK [Chloroflexota bacterium]